MTKEMYTRKFSMAHSDASTDDDIFLQSFENSSQQYKNEIHDIYFGVTFLHRDVTFGDTMGANASDGQYRNLLKIQEKHGIPISLTLNEMNRPLRMIRPDVVKDFVSFLKKYYDDGVRSCTISHTHLMRMGALQEAFPEMQWKNTVNHRVRTTQEFVDYVKLGYTTVQLDRNFNRSIGELKRVRKEADRLGVKTCLLIRENCMPECPFKTEHDSWHGGSEFRDLGQQYWSIIPFSCNKWRTKNPMQKSGTQKEMERQVANPRTGTDIIARTSDDWKEFASLVDVFKMSGRLNAPSSKTLPKRGYIFDMYIPENVKNNVAPLTKTFMVDSFKEIYENNLAPLHMWFSIIYLNRDFPYISDIEEIRKEIAGHFWNTGEAVDLCNVLKNCKNQCYRCHLCDKVFETGEIDSILEL